MHQLDSKAELLTILAEECGEVGKCVTKYLRFGEESEYLQHTPVELEVGDVMAVLDMLFERGHLDRDKVEKYRAEKYAKMTDPVKSLVKNL